MGYHGEFTVNIATQELESVRIVTDDMPEAAQVCGVSLNVDYARVSVNGIEFYLPSRVAMDIFNPTHGRTLTVMNYGGCHEFYGESVLRFDGAPAASAKSTNQSARTLGPNLRLAIRITTRIHAETAWAGDPIEGEVTKDVIDEHGAVIVPKGSRAAGRLLHWETWQKPSRSYTVALQFRSLTIGGHAYSLNLRVVPPPEFAAAEGTGLRPRVALHNPPLGDDPAGCRFRLAPGEADLKGVVTYWITE